MANRYSRIFHHISINDVKKNREIVVERRRVQFEKKKRNEEYIVEKMKDKKSDWRNELKEQPVFKAVPVDTGKMTSSQSFAVFTNFGGDDSDTGLRFSIDGGLGGTESLPIFNYPLEAGGTVPAIDFSTPVGSGTAQINLGDFPLSGYAMPLGGEMYRSITQRKKEEINKELDSSEEYTKQIKADALMKARVGDGPAVVKIYKASDFTPGEGLADTYSPEQLQKLSVQNPQKFSEYKHISDISDEMTKKVETSFEKIDQEYSDQWEPKLSSLLPSNQYSDLYKKHGGSAFNEVNIEINRLYYEEQKAMTRVKTKDGIKLRSNKKSRAIRATANKISDAIPTLQELQNKLDDIRQSKMDVVVAENRREMKALQKAAPKFFLPNGELKPLPMYMGLKASDPYGMIYDLEGDDSQTEPTTEPTTNKVSQEIDTKGDTLSSDEMNALLSRGFEKDAINDVLSQGGIDSLRDILSGNIEAGFFSGDSKKPLDISKLRSTLYLRYMTGNKKPFTEKNLSKQQLKSLERQVIQNLTTKSLATTNLVSNLGSATKDITGTLNKRQRFALGLDKNDFVYTVSSYTKTPMKDNDLRYLLGNYIVVTTVRNGKRVVKEIRDDFDFKYGYEVDRSDGSFAGDSYTKRKKGGQSVDLGRGIFVGSETGGEDPFKVKAGRTGVNIGAGLGIGSPVPIKIKFVKESVNESNLFSKIKKNKKNK